MSKFRLVMKQGPSVGRAYDLNKDVMVIGRDVKNDIIINDGQVSRDHTRLIVMGETYQVEDLVSTNGTFVNGQRLGPPRVLQAGDLLGLGDTIVLEFMVEGMGAPTMTYSRPATPVTPTPTPVAPPPSAYTPPSQTAPLAPEPAYASTGPMLGSANPPPQPAPTNWPVIIGVGCGCLAVLACLAIVVVIAGYYFTQMR